MKFTILGVRGSMPNTADRLRTFGGATSGYLVEIGDEAIYLDAGSGLMRPCDTADKNISILLSHPHLDHIIGLPIFLMNQKKDQRVTIYAKQRKDLDARAQVDRVFSPPTWPIRMDENANPVIYQTLPEEKESSFEIGDVTVETLEGNHPGGCSIYRLTHDGKRIVYATDYEHSADSDERLIAYAKDCDLLIYDGQYTEDEYEKCRGFGHSTAEHGLSIAESAGAAYLLITHFNPDHTDEFLKNREEEIKKKAVDLPFTVTFAKVGDTIEL